MLQNPKSYLQSKKAVLKYILQGRLSPEVPIQILGRLATICKSGLKAKAGLAKTNSRKGRNSKGGNPMKKLLAVLLSILMLAMPLTSMAENSV